MGEAERQFCRNIAVLRRVKGMTQKEMAEILGVSVSTVRKMEKGEKIPRLKARLLCRVYEAFQISSDVMLFEDLE